MHIPDLSAFQNLEEVTLQRGSGIKLRRKIPAALDEYEIDSDLYYELLGHEDWAPTRNRRLVFRRVTSDRATFTPPQGLFHEVISKP